MARNYFRQQALRLRNEYDAKFSFFKEHIAFMTPEEKDLARLDLEHLSDKIRDAQRAAALEKD